MEGPRCTGCGSLLAANVRFCSACGTPASAARTEERRTVSILFADLSGYTAMSERMDPEAVKGVVAQALGRLADEVARHGGHVDKFIGDNVMALFGAPVAHEDDAQRAVRTGLAMQGAMAEINERVAAQVGAELRLCVGVNTGEVLAGAMGAGYTVMGDAVNVAARLQSAAEPGTVLVGPATQTATRDEIEYAAVGPITLKGKAEAVPAWRAISVRTDEARALSDETPLVGRSNEMRSLEALYAAAVQSGRSVTATVLGEPGVGKSRLARELASRLSVSEPPATVRWGRSVAYGSGSAYWAIGEVLRQQCGIDDGDSVEVSAAKLSRMLRDLISGDTSPSPAEEAQVDRAMTALAPVVGAVAAGDLPDEPAAARDATFAAVRLVLTAVAQRGPLVLVLEDLHWADSGVLDLVDYLADSLEAPVLIVALARPELLERMSPRVSAEAGRAVLRLAPLAEDEVAEMVTAVTRGRDLGISADAIVARCSGIPLFVEEMVRHLTELDETEVAGVPRTLQALLVARLDQLDAGERQLLQRAAVLGASFSAADLRAAVGDVVDATTCDELVERAAAKGFLRREGDELWFHHVLVRDAAYSLLPKAERARLHMDAADRIERRLGDRGDPAVGVLAEHYLQAAVLAEAAFLPEAERERARSGALRHLLAAGDRAGSLSSNETALAQYEAASNLTASPDLLVDLSERIGDAAMRLGDPTKAIEAWQRAQGLLAASSAERLAELDRKIGSAFLRAGEREAAIERFEAGISRLVHRGPHANLIRLYEDAALLYSEAGENMLAIYAGEQALAAAQGLGMVAAASRARGVFGVVLGRMGDTEGARRSFEAALQPDGLDDASRAALLRAFARHLRSHEGDTTAAAARLDEALVLADRVGDVPLQVDLAGELAEIALHQGDWARLEELTVACERLRHEGGFTGRRALPYRLRAVLARQRGDLEESRALFRSSWENARATGTAEEAVAALRGLAVVELLSASPADAALHLSEATRLCDDGDMLAASVEVAALRVVALAQAGEASAASSAMEDAQQRADRCGTAAAGAAVLEAEGMLRLDPTLLARAQQAWLSVGRPVDAARCVEHVERLAR